MTTQEPKENDFVHSDPEIMGGVPCIKGTRIPLDTFFAHALAGRLYEVYPQYAKPPQEKECQRVPILFGPHCRDIDIFLFGLGLGILLLAFLIVLL